MLFTEWTSERTLWYCTIFTTIMIIITVTNVLSRHVFFLLRRRQTHAILLLIRLVYRSDAHLPSTFVYKVFSVKKAN